MARPWLTLLDPGLTALKTSAGSTFEDRLALARALNGRARHEEAQEVLDQLLAEDRAHAEAWFERLLCFSDHAGDEEGLELLGQLESLRDEHPAEGGHLRNLGYLRPRRTPSRQWRRHRYPGSTRPHTRGADS